MGPEGKGTVSLQSKTCGDLMLAGHPSSSSFCAIKDSCVETYETNEVHRNGMKRLIGKHKLRKGKKRESKLAILLPCDGLPNATEFSESGSRKLAQVCE